MHTSHSFMDRTIFHLNLSTLATSLYILLCTMLDNDQSPTLALSRKIWGGTEQEFDNAAEELIREGVLLPLDFSDVSARWWVNPSTDWFRRDPVRARQ